MSRDDGGPAFPCSIKEGHNAPEMPGGYTESEIIHPGMTLRDYFAAKALQGILAGDKDAYPGQAFLDQNEAGRAYEIADAMLEAREDDPSQKEGGEAG